MNALKKLAGILFLLAGAVRAAIQPNTRLVFIETPANPTLKLADIHSIAEVVHAHQNILPAVDNTFLTPMLQDCPGLAQTSRCSRPPNTSTVIMRRLAALWRRMMQP